jgi:hypothetical protein
VLNPIHHRVHMRLGVVVLDDERLTVAQPQVFKNLLHGFTPLNLGALVLLRPADVQMVDRLLDPLRRRCGVFHLLSHPIGPLRPLKAVPRPGVVHPVLVLSEVRGQPAKTAACAAAANHSMRSSASRRSLMPS